MARGLDARERALEGGVGLAGAETAARVEHLVQFPEDRVRTLKLEMETEMSDAMEVGQSNDLSSYVDDVVAKLYDLARGDTEVIQILDCFAVDQVDRRDIMRVRPVSTS